MNRIAKLAFAFSLGLTGPAFAEMLDVEKDELTLGFIKLTDMAPLAVAYENGYFEDEGLFVTLEPQANWKVLHVDQGIPFNMGMVFPVSTHNYELRYWLAAGGIKPGYYSPENVSGQIDADVLLSVTPPPQMPATMEAGTIFGYCVGEPWNQQAVFKGIGVPVITDYEMWKNNPEKVFGITAEFAQEYPNTTLALTKALIRAAIWLDENDNANRPEAVEILARSEYVGADAEVIANSMTGFFEYEKGDKRDVPDFNVFFRYNGAECLPRQPANWPQRRTKSCGERRRRLTLRLAPTHPSCRGHLSNPFGAVKMSAITDPDMEREERRARLFTRINKADTYFTVLGLSWVTPVLKAVAGDNPSAQVKEIWRLLAVPLLAILGFLVLWGSPPITTRSGRL